MMESVKVIADSRICITTDGASFNIKRQDISVEDTREVLKRLSFYVYLVEFGIPALSKDAVVESFDVHPAVDGEPTKVCVAYNPDNHKIQCVVTGLGLWDTSVLLEHAVAYFNGMIILPDLVK